MRQPRPSAAVSDSEHVFLSIQSPNIREPILFLRIPHVVFAQYSTKPRKWLQYTGFAITGKEGILFLDPPPDLELRVEQEPHACDVELGVEAGDRFIYRLDEEPALFDSRLRNPGRSRQASLDSDTTSVHHIRAYGRCPFTRTPAEGGCDACHLIPRDRGDSYMEELYRLRGDVDSTIGIDDPKNVLLLNKAIHGCLDSGEVAFLKTPNFALKSNEVVLNRPDGKDAEAYRVTVHCFSTNEDALNAFAHGSSSDLLISFVGESAQIDFVENERKGLFGDGEPERRDDPEGEKESQDSTPKAEMEAYERAVKEEGQRKIRETEAWVQGMTSGASVAVALASSVATEPEPAENELRLH